MFFYPPLSKNVYICIIQCRICLMLLKKTMIQTERYVGDVSAVSNPMHGASANVHGASRYTLRINLGEVGAYCRYCADTTISHTKSMVYTHKQVCHNLSEVNLTGAFRTPCTFADAPCMGLCTADTSPTCLFHWIDHIAHTLSSTAFRCSPTT